MADDNSHDHYETLQVSANADPETIHRVYRLLAQRAHPDNQETGNSAEFQRLTDAYKVLSDPARRAQFDAVYPKHQQERWRLVATGASAENDYEIEELLRFTLLEVLYTQRRIEPQTPGIFILDLERLIGRPREHLQFALWYLKHRQLIEPAENSRLVITVDGVDHVEQQYRSGIRRRLRDRETPLEETEVAG